LQWANGYSSSPFSDFIRTLNNLPKPVRERPLDWDIRHQIIFFFFIICPPKKHVNLFGIKLPDDWNITLLSRFSSGRPYTPGTLDPLEARVRENGETMPYTISSDVKISKTFKSFLGNITIFSDIFYFFNRRNAMMVNNWTGKPIKYGDTVGGTNEIYSWKQMKALMSPYWWSPPRYIQLGIRVNID